MQRVRFWKTLLHMLLPLLCAGLAFSQETTGTLRGVVTDPTGAVVPGAKVDVAGGTISQSMTSDSSGNFAFATLPPGVYSVSVTAQGFVPVKQMNIPLEVGKVLRIDFKLEVGATTQTVEVIAEAAIVDTAQSTVAANVTSASFDRLPKGRGFDSLIALAPGARYEDKSGGFQVDGASGAENVYIIDGMDMTNVYSGALSNSGKIPFEFVQELQVKSSGFEAQFGGAMGGVINVITKSGTNAFHGDAGLYFRTDSMQARPRPTLEADPEDETYTKAKYVQNFVDSYRYLSPGATVSGPIWKDKAWFFAGYYPELTKYERPVTFLADGSKGTFTQKDRRDYLNGKIDVAPFDKLRAYVGYIYSPFRRNGNLPARDGTSDPELNWVERGYRSPAASYTFGADYSATPRLILSARGGYNYTNTKDYGVPRGTSVYQSSNVKFPEVPDAWKQNYGGYTPGYGANPLTVKTIQTRFRTNADASYMFNAGGQHTFKTGYEINRLHMDASSGNWPDGYLRFYWGTPYTIQYGPNRGTTVGGKYGYIRYYLYGESGGASSDNQSVFVQDAWQIHRRLTLQLGLRTEREFVPSFQVGDNMPSKAIEFGFGQKLAPRIGFAYDVKGDGKWRIAGSFGLFYDLMKYSLPQGSFGGALYKMWFYPLDKPDPSAYIPLIPRGSAGEALPQTLKGMTPIEMIDYRIPSNSPDDNRIDPNLKPMRRRVWDISSDYALSASLVFSARYTHNSVDRVVEDIGYSGEGGEVYIIGNPGFGMSADPKQWPAGIPPTPKAVRNYDAMELRLDKRFAKGYYFSTSYTLSRLYGNFSGLASTDEPDADGLGRMDPNASRYFDQPYMSYDSHGKLVEGRLATDRPHALKFFGGYTWKNKLGETNFGTNFFVMSGTPLTTEVAVNGSAPVYVNGRGDMGRTPVFSQTDLYFYHEVKMPHSESMKVKFDANISNLFNQSTVTNKDVTLLHPSLAGILSFNPDTEFFKGFDYKAMLASGVADGSLYTNPSYGWAKNFQGPRYVRLGLKFIF